MAAIKDLELGAADRTGERPRIGRRRETVVAAGDHERWRHDLPQPRPSIVVAARLELEGEAGRALRGVGQWRERLHERRAQSDILVGPRVDELDHPCERGLRLEREDLVQWRRGATARDPRAR